MTKKKPDPRQHEGKQSHTEAEAFKQLAALRRKDGAFGMQVYKCQICGNFHVGHKPRSRGGHR